MFDSLEAARRLQSSAIREYVGYPKVAAVWIAAFLIARFWSKRSAKAAVVVPLHILGKAAIGIAAIIAVGFVVVKSLAMVSPQLGIIATLLSGVIQAMLFLWTIGVWLDDEIPLFTGQDRQPAGLKGDELKEIVILGRVEGLHPDPVSR